jgi:cytochrome c-type biogenesis protein CcmH/NrfG
MTNYPFHQASFKLINLIFKLKTQLKKIFLKVQPSRASPTAPKNHLLFFLTTCFLSVLLAILTPARVSLAGENIQASRFYEEAVVQFRNNDTKAAIINLKNALQQNPKYLAAHILLGQAYLREKDLALAEHELTVAEQLGADKSLLVLSRAQLYLYEIKYSPLLQEINPSQYSSSLQPTLYLYRGHAHFQLNQLNEALKEYETAAHLNPQLAAPILGKANVLLRQGYA